jgi:hypothetical protein
VPRDRPSKRTAVLAGASIGNAFATSRSFRLRAFCCSRLILANVRRTSVVSALRYLNSASKTVLSAMVPSSVAKLPFARKPSQAWLSLANAPRHRLMRPGLRRRKSVNKLHSVLAVTAKLGGGHPNCPLVSRCCANRLRAFKPRQLLPWVRSFSFGIGTPAAKAA